MTQRRASSTPVRREGHRSFRAKVVCGLALPVAFYTVSFAMAPGASADITDNFLNCRSQGAEL